MKLLLCHNYYRYRGGEDLSFEADVAMLRENGHEVVTYTVDNHDLEDGESRLKTAKRAIWNSSTAKEVQAILAQERPDLMHCNNLFPQISPSIYQPARKAGIPIVAALRNYRHFCANSFFYRDGQVCTKCLGRCCAYAAIRHKCYRDSRLASGVVAAMQLAHRGLGSRRNAVDAYFTPSQFARSTYISGGFKAEQIHVKTNYIHPDPGPGVGNGDFVLFVGRLSQEKGIDTLIDAWHRHQIQVPLRIVGEGPLRSRVEQFASENSQVRYLGEKEPAEVLDLMGQAKALLIPSLWYETFGRTIAESFSKGTPVIASDLGAMAELVDHGRTGYRFRSGDTEDLSNQLQRLMEQADYSTLRVAAREEYLKRFTQQVSYQQLLQIYKTVRSP